MANFIIFFWFVTIIFQRNKVLYNATRGHSVSVTEWGEVGGKVQILTIMKFDMLEINIISTENDRGKNIF